jgi:hypothetical protein
MDSLKYRRKNRSVIIQEKRHLFEENSLQNQHRKSEKFH